MTGRLFVIYAAKRYNFGEHWRIWARPVIGPIPEEVSLVLLMKDGAPLLLSINDYEVKSNEVEFCTEVDLMGEEEDYVGVQVLSIDSKLRVCM